MATTREEAEKIAVTCPWLTVVEHSGDIIIGVVQFVTPKTTSIYRYDRIQDLRLRKIFLKLAKKWYDECFDEMSIDAWYGESFAIFAPALVTFATPSLVFIHCPQPVTIGTERKRRTRLTMEDVRRRMERYGGVSVPEIVVRRPDE